MLLQTSHAAWFVSVLVTTVNPAENGGTDPDVVLEHTRVAQGTIRYDTAPCGLGGVVE